MDDIKNISFDDDRKEGVDYYMSRDGFRIPTALGLIKRGYCCGNGCKNCPYDPKAIKGNTQRAEYFQ